MKRVFSVGLVKRDFKESCSHLVTTSAKRVFNRADQVLTEVRASDFWHRVTFWIASKLTVSFGTTALPGRQGSVNTGTGGPEAARLANPD